MGILARKTVFKRNAGKLSIQKQYKFMYRLIQLLERKYNLREALEVISWDKELINMTEAISHSMFIGNTFDKSLKDAGFQSNVINFLAISAQYGNLSYGVKHCCYILRQQIDLIKRFKQLSTYPILLFIFFLIILYVLRTFIFPSFQSLLTAEASTTSVFYTTSLIVDGIFYGLITLFTVITLIYILYPYLKKHLTIEQKINITVKLPFWCKYKKMQLTFLFTTHLASLLHSGLNIKECLQVLRESNIDPVITHYVKMMDLHLNKGFSANSILPIFQLFEKDLQSIMQKDHNVIQLTEELHLFSDHLLRMMEELLQKWLKILQPALLIFLAVLIVFVYLTMMFPMFDYIQTI
ncbi:type II secretion system F family protein [Gracilibacillus ureilyticus]|nr:type II secretion system F family protein [Gracilibacillus ureilyticus]